MTISDWACLEIGLTLLNGMLRDHAIENQRPLDQQRLRSRRPRRALTRIDKRMSDDARLRRGGGRRTREPACAQLVQAFLGSRWDRTSGVATTDLARQSLPGDVEILRRQ